MWVVVDEAGGAAQEGRRHRAQSPRRPALTGGCPQACGGVGVVQHQAYREVFKRLEGALGEGDGRGLAPGPPPGPGAPATKKKMGKDEL